MLITKKMMKHADKLQYKPSYQRKLMRRYIDIISKEKVMITTMEELSELMDSVSHNMSGKKDYIHIAEEIADVIICSKYLCMIYNISEKEIKQLKKTQKIKASKSNMFFSFSKLCNCIKAISKELRRNQTTVEVAVEVISDIQSVVKYYIKMFDIHEKDINRIIKLKMRRIENHINAGTL